MARLRSCIAHGLLLFACTAPAFAETAEPADATRSRVAVLIEQLAAPEYVTRRSAELELEQIGLPAFDQVLAATRSPDPEVAAASEYLLSKLSVEWASPDDPPVVRRMLADFGSSSEKQRLDVVDSLATWTNSRDGRVRGGIPALCRIARFDPSSLVSQRAAAAAMNADEQQVPGERFDAIADALQRLSDQHGASERPSSRWLKVFAKQPDLPVEEALNTWDGIVQPELVRFQQDRQAVDAKALLALGWNRLRLQLASGDERVAASVALVVDLAEKLGGDDSAEDRLGSAFEWLIDVEAQAAIDEVIEARKAKMATKQGRYLFATVRARQGRQDQAETLAAEARQTPHAEGLQLGGGKVLDGRIEIAARLRADGYHEWAYNEYRDVIEEGPPLSAGVVYSQIALADALQDSQRYGEAADTLEGLTTRINADARSKRDYDQLVEAWGVRLVKPAKLIDARRHYCRALAQRAAGDEDAARLSLAQAIQSDGRDADVLIAMYRSEGASPSYRREVLRRIRELAAEFEQEIESDPGDDEPLNQWAWLISNTEGDYERAINYSKRSLQVSPGDPGYLDTLGRCYFAAGKFEEAVATQQRAVKQMPHMLVMQRQLAEFEAALAASNSKVEE